VKKQTSATTVGAPFVLVRSKPIAIAHHIEPRETVMASCNNVKQGQMLRQVSTQLRDRLCNLGLPAHLLRSPRTVIWCDSLGFHTWSIRPYYGDPRVLRIRFDNDTAIFGRELQKKVFGEIQVSFISRHSFQATTNGFEFTLLDEQVGQAIDSIFGNFPVDKHQVRQLAPFELIRAWNDDYFWSRRAWDEYKSRNPSRQRSATPVGEP